MFHLIVFNLLPMFGLGMFSTYYMPILLNRMIGYPVRIEDEFFDESENVEKFVFEQTTQLQEQPRGKPFSSSFLVEKQDFLDDFNRHSEYVPRRTINL
jgi:hypothetical protein